MTSIDGLYDWDTGRVQNLAYIFANTANLGGFDGNGVRDWNTKNVTDFSHAFDGSALTTLDLRGWDMGGAVAAAAGTWVGMLANVAKLRTLTLGEKVIIEGTGLDTSNADIDDTHGVWVAHVADADRTAAWFGPSVDLARRYPDAKTHTSGFRDLGADGQNTPITYTWDSRRLGGRFLTGDDDEAWWQFISSTDHSTGEDRGALIIGTDVAAPYTLELTDLVAREQWGDVIARLMGYTVANAQHQAMGQVTSVRFQALADGSPAIRLTANSLGTHAAPGTGLHPTEATAGLLAADYTALTSFDGLGLDVSDVESLADMLREAKALTKVVNVGTWKTGKVQTLHSFLEGASRLESIDGMEADAATGAWDTSRVRDFSRLFYGTGNFAKLNDYSFVKDWVVTATAGTYDAANPTGAGFTQMFAGSSAKNVDLSGWAMPQDAAISGMFANATHLSTLTLNPTILLWRTPSAGTVTPAAETTGLESIPTRLARYGSWDTTNTALRGGYTSTDLAKVYRDAANPSPVKPASGTTRYVFSENKISGRFPSNENDWWWFKDGVLHLGSEDSSSTASVWVSETSSEVPWKTDASLNNPNPPKGVTRYVMTEKVTRVEFDTTFTPLNFDSWFANYPALISFNGKNCVLPAAGETSDWSLARLFENDAALIVVDNIDDWDVSRIIAFDGMFSGCSSVNALDIHSWQMTAANPSGTPATEPTTTNMLKGMGRLETLVLGNATKLGRDAGLGVSNGRPVTAGSWLRQAATEGSNSGNAYTYDPWFGSSADLLARYATSSNYHVDGENHEGAYYNWYPGVFQGRLSTRDTADPTENNDNVWWSLNTGTGTLTIGVDAPETVVAAGGASAVGSPLETVGTPGGAFGTGWADVTVSAADLPWLAALPATAKAASGERRIQRVLFQSYTSSGATPATYQVRIRSLADWFRAYLGLTSFDGTNLDVVTARLACGHVRGRHRPHHAQPDGLDLGQRYAAPGHACRPFRADLDHARAGRPPAGPRRRGRRHGHQPGLYRDGPRLQDHVPRREPRPLGHAGRRGRRLGLLRPRDQRRLLVRQHGVARQPLPGDGIGPQGRPRVPLGRQEPGRPHARRRGQRQREHLVDLQPGRAGRPARPPPHRGRGRRLRHHRAQHRARLRHGHFLQPHL